MSAYRRGLTGKPAALGYPATEAAQKDFIFAKNSCSQDTGLHEKLPITKWQKYHTRDTATVGRNGNH